jgi:hypothetical protein
VAGIEKTIYFRPRTFELIENRTTGVRTISQVVCRSIERYAEVAFRHHQEFSPGEEQLLHDSFVGWDPDALSIMWLPLRVENYALSRGINADPLLDRLKKFSYAECVATLDEIECRQAQRIRNELAS